MEVLHKRRVFCKEEDWPVCHSHGVTFTPEGFTLARGVHSGGLLCLKALDSGEKGFEWGRVSLKSRVPADSLIRTFAYASDTRLFGGGFDMDEYLGGLTLPEAKAGLNGIFVPVGSSEDFYVNLTGRFLWLMFEFIASGEPPVLTRLSVHMAGDHMADYLPAIYRKRDDFIKRFLSIFDSMYMDMEDAIYGLPARFDLESADPAMLRYLAGWVCVDAAELDDATTLERIRTAFSDYESMYTMRGVKRSVKRLTGRDPFIIESADVDPNRPGCANSELYRRLYGENPYKFFILLEEDVFCDRARMERFLGKMRELIPAHTEFELVMLRRCVQLDRHTYLGVNSFVSNYVPVVIDENTSIYYDTMIGGNEVEGF